MHQVNINILYLLLYLQQTVRISIAESRLEIDQCRLLVLHKAAAVDTLGPKKARKQVIPFTSSVFGAFRKIIKFYSLTDCCN